MNATAAFSHSGHSSNLVTFEIITVVNGGPPFCMSNSRVFLHLSQVYVMVCIVQSFISELLLPKNNEYSNECNGVYGNDV
jgi:hypothetical protein